MSINAQWQSSSPQNVNPPTSVRLHFIDGLRALALFLVLGTHYLYHTHATCPFYIGFWHSDLFAPFRYGAVGVDLFLVLSGFCLYFPLVSLKSGKVRPEPTLWEFARRRARRILPPYYASLILFSFWQYGKSHLDLRVSDIAAPPTAANILAHVSMVHTLRPEWLYGINPPYWSLGLEWFLYIGFPLFVVGFSRLGTWPPLLAVTGLALAFKALMAGLLPADQGFFNTSLFARWPEFVLGMVAASIIARDRLPQMRGNWGLLVSCSVLLMTLAISTQSSRTMSPLYNLLWGGAFFALVLAGSIQNRPLHKVLSWRPFVWLGVISYSVYLTHFPLMHLLAAVTKHHLQNGVSFVVAWLFIFLPVTIGLGYFFHLLFEKPFMNAPKVKPTLHVPVPRVESVTVLAPAGKQHTK